MNRWSAWASILYHFTGTDVTRDALNAPFSKFWRNFSSSQIRKTSFLDRSTISNQFRLRLCFLPDLLILLFSSGDLHELKPRRGAHCLQLSSEILEYCLFIVIRPYLHFYLLAFFTLVFILNFRTLFVYIFACAPLFSFVKGYRLIAESLCF